MPEISVVIPSYNHDCYILHAVNSVLGQSFADLELIVVDDGSTDRTLETLSTVVDQRMKVLSQTNLGAHVAVNQGLHLATGKYISILNSDDYYHPDRLRLMADVLDKDPRIGLVSSHIEIVNDSDQVIGIKHDYEDCEPWLLDHPELSFRSSKDFMDAILTENYLASTSNFFFSHSWLEKVGEFRPLRFTHDWDFALRMAKFADLAVIKKPLLSYRVHSENTIRSDHFTMIFEICWILAVHLPDFITGSAFYEKTAPEIRIEQLLHSIYTYNCDRVLNVMLLLDLNNDHQHAMNLLNPADPEREMLIKYIQKSVSQTPVNPVNKLPASRLSTLKATAARIIRHLRS